MRPSFWHSKASRGENIVKVLSVWQPEGHMPLKIYKLYISRYIDRFIYIAIYKQQKEMKKIIEFILHLSYTKCSTSRPTTVPNPQFGVDYHLRSWSTDLLICAWVCFTPKKKAVVVPSKSMWIREDKGSRVQFSCQDKRVSDCGNPTVIEF